MTKACTTEKEILKEMVIMGLQFNHIMCDVIYLNVQLFWIEIGNTVYHVINRTNTKSVNSLKRF